jgi:hypothetical protein
VSYERFRRWLLRVVELTCVLAGLAALDNHSSGDWPVATAALTLGLAALMEAVPLLSRGGPAAVQRRAVRLGRRRQPGLVFRRSRSKRLLLSVGAASSVRSGS